MIAWPPFLHAVEGTNRHVFMESAGCEGVVKLAVRLGRCLAVGASGRNVLCVLRAVRRCG